MLPVTLVLAVFSPRAEACSCVDFENMHANEALCAGAARIFAGTIAAYDNPLMIDLAETWLDPGRGWRDDANPYVLLEVDTVWQGIAPARTITHTGWGSGDCGIRPAPGLRFLACDDGDGATPWSFCRGPLVSEGKSDLERSFGPGAAPTPVREGLPRRWGRVRTLAAALFVTAIGALGGLGLSRLRVRAPVALASWVMFPLALVLVSGSLLARRWDQLGDWWPPGAVVPIVIAFGAGLAAGLWGQLVAPGRRLAGLLAAMIVAVLPLATTRLSLHWPWPTDAEILCSIDRARGILARTDAGGPSRHLLTEKACTDFGHGWMVHTDHGYGPIVVFPAGDHLYYVVDPTYGAIHFGRMPSTYR